jgi:hypothetical protein
VFIPTLLLLALIGATPAILFADALMVRGLVAAVAALALGIAGRSIRLGEAQHFLKSIGPAAAIMAIPAIWILVQALPLAFSGLAHSIWDSASAALGNHLTGSISIDPDAPLISLCSYCSFVAIWFLAAAVAVERQRAEWLLFMLAAAAVLIAIATLTRGFGVEMLRSSLEHNPAYAQAIDTTVLGLIFSAALVVRAAERFETSRVKSGVSVRNFVRSLAAALAVLSVCTVTLLVRGSGEAIFAAALGLTMFIAVIAGRRFGLGLWGSSALVAAVVVAAGPLVLLHPGWRSGDVTVAFATQASAHFVSTTERILTDAGWLGTGAGTFAALVPIYREVGTPDTASAPTAAAGIAVEFGEPALWVAVLAMIGIIIALLRGALQRGRDGFNPAAGASCVLALTLLAFANPGLLTSSLSITAPAALGLALAQSKSRTAK